MSFTLVDDGYAAGRLERKRATRAHMAAGVGPEGAEQAVEAPGPEALRLGRDKLAGCGGYTEKVRRNLLRVYDAYVGGRTLAEVAAELGMSKGGVSTYLSRITEIVGFRVVRGHGPGRKAGEDEPKGVPRRGLKRVNQRGFHAFRSTWVTLALSAGVPMELVRRVTGHTTTQIVLDHYFQPGREEFRAALTGAMPAVLTGGAGKPVGSGQSAVGSGQSEGRNRTAEPGKDANHGTHGKRTGESEVVRLAGKVAAGTATEGEKKRLGRLLAGARE